MPPTNSPRPLPLLKHAEQINRRDNPYSVFADDPRTMLEAYWPQVRFYQKQWELVESVRDVPETFCVAAHKMGA